jgi:hypothetical protein
MTDQAFGVRATQRMRVKEVVIMVRSQLVKEVG